MKSTGVACAYGEPSGLTAEKVLVPAGNRVRVFSVVCCPRSGNNANDTWGYRLLDGSGGDVLIETRFSNVVQARGGCLGMAPVNIPSNGIIFSDGVVVQGLLNGITAASITFQNIPEQI
tara:strand:+ start:336 stop:692 length:357 start_codon:yes stop_codon:yes gene_type:complete